jgi:hypothetical protein
MLFSISELGARRDLRQFALERQSELAKAAEQVQCRVTEFVRFRFRNGV